MYIFEKSNVLMTIWSLIIGAMFWFHLVIIDGIDDEFLTIYDLTVRTPISCVFAHHMPFTKGINLLDVLEIHIDNARNE